MPPLRRVLRLPLPGKPCIRIVYDEHDRPTARPDRTIDWDEARRRFRVVQEQASDPDDSTTTLLLVSGPG